MAYIFEELQFRNSLEKNHWCNHMILVVHLKASNGAVRIKIDRWNSFRESDTNQN